MKITVAGQVYEYDPERLLNTEAIALQRHTGFTPPEFGERLGKGDAIAMTGLVWLLWRREGKHVRWEDVEFDFADFQVDTEDEEAEVEAEAAPNPPDGGQETTSQPAVTSTSSPSPSTSASNPGTPTA